MILDNFGGYFIKMDYIKLIMIHKNGKITVSNNKTGGQYGGFNTGMECRRCCYNTAHNFMEG